VEPGRLGVDVNRVLSEAVAAGTVLPVVSEDDDGAAVTETVFLVLGELKAPLTPTVVATPAPAAVRLEAAVAAATILAAEVGPGPMTRMGRICEEADIAADDAVAEA